MNTASRWIMILGLAVAATGVMLPAERAQAQDVQITGPLAGAPAVRRMRIYRDGRFQLQPTFGITLQDEFAQTVFAGLQLQYHFTDWLGFGGFFDYGATNFNTGLTDQVTKRGQSTTNNRLSLPSESGFKNQIGELNFLAGGQVTFIPLRGKLGLFQALFVDTDFYVFGGLAAAQVTERKDITGQAAKTCAMATAATAPGLCTQSADQTRIALAPTFGVGLSLYLTDFMGLTLEYRAFPFAWNTSGTDEGGLSKSRKPDSGGEFPDGELDKDDRIFKFNQMFSLGLAFYLPFQSEVTK